MLDTIAAQALSAGGWTMLTGMSGMGAAIGTCTTAATIGRKLFGSGSGADDPTASGAVATGESADTGPSQIASDLVYVTWWGWIARELHLILNDLKYVLKAMAEGVSAGFRKTSRYHVQLLMMVMAMFMLPILYLWYDMLTTARPTGWTKMFYLLTDPTDTKFERQLDLVMATTSQGLGALLTLWFMYAVVCGTTGSCDASLHAPVTLVNSSLDYSFVDVDYDRDIDDIMQEYNALLPQQQAVPPG